MGPSTGYNLKCTMSYWHVITHYMCYISAPAPYRNFKPAFTYDFNTQCVVKEDMTDSVM